MIDTFDREQLEAMIASTGGPHITIFLPAQTRAFDAKEDEIQLSNLAREARETLSKYWMTDRDSKRFLEPINNLLRDPEFLKGRRHGIAIFLSSDVFRVFRMTEPVEQQIAIARTFYLRPMISVVDPFASFDLLTLSKSHVALYSVTSQSISELDDLQLPGAFDKLLLETTADRGAQAHSSGRGSMGKQAAVFHGQGGMPEKEKSELLEYMRAVDNAVCSYIGTRGRNTRRRLLVLAGVDYVTTIYRKVSAHPRLAGSTISGNVDRLSPDQLFQRAIPIAVAETVEEREADAGRIREPRRNSVATDPEQVLCAAYEGRIEVLFFDTAAELYGSFYPDTRTLKVLRDRPSGDPGDPSHDLVEAALAQTLRHGGRVHPVCRDDMPVDKDLAAILRY